MSIQPLSSLPPKWAVRKLKHLASIRFSNVDKRTADDEYPVRLCNYMDVYHNHEITTEIDFMEASASKAEIEKFSLKRGDVLITKDSESWDDIAISARVGSDMPEVLCGYHLAQIRSRRELLDDRFLNYCFNAPDVQYHFHTCATGITRYGLSNGEIGSAPIPVAHIDRQTAIADLLDRETARIDALITKEERLLELLEEKRTALIRHAVTKGLDPNAELKDSGIEWIGQIPKRWDKTRLSVVCYFEQGKAHEPYIDDAGDHICVNSRFVSTEGSAEKRSRENLSPAQKNDILMVMSDLPNGRALAKAFFVKDERSYAVNQRVCLLRSKKANPTYMYFLLNRNPHFLRYDDGHNQTHLPNSAFKQMPIFLPPVDTQSRIAEFLTDECVRFYALKEKITRAIELLREKRTALISAAVTGKIEVKGGSQ